MPTARKLPSGSWRCQVFSHFEEIRQPDGTVKKKRIYKSFTCDIPTAKGKREAERIAAAWAAEKESASKYNKTVGTAMDEYIESRTSVLSPSTIREYKRSRRCDLQGLMNIKLYALTQEMVQNEINHESLNHSPKSVRNMHGLLSAVLRQYRPEFVLTTALPKKRPPSLHIPLDSDVKKVMDYVSGTEMEIPILLAAFGPMRRGEIAALDSEHISGNIIHIEFSMALNENNEWVKKSPKSISGDRYIEFPDFVVEKLKDIDGPITDLKPNQISDRFIDIIKRTGVEKFRFHDLRHYSASIQHALGIPDAYIMQRGGWGNDTVLKTVYRHTLEDKSKEMNAIANNHFSQLYNTKCNTDKENP